jgi:hypothetical protein
MNLTIMAGIERTGPMNPRDAKILAPEAYGLIACRFNLTTTGQGELLG